MASYVHHVNTFTGCPLDRCHAHRHDEAWLGAQRTATGARWIAFHKMRPLVRQGRGGMHVPCMLSRDEVKGAFGIDVCECAWGTQVFLGTHEAQPVFAISVTRPGANARESAEKLGGRFVNLVLHAIRLSKPTTGTLAYARHLLHFHYAARYCERCGAPCRARGGGARRVCTSAACGRAVFPRNAPVAIMAVEHVAARTATHAAPARRLLLGRQRTWPAGMWSCLAGFVDAGESVEEAAVREVAEESGVVCDVRSARYHSSQPWPFPHSFMCGLVLCAVSPRVRVDERELEAARWFSHAEIGSMLRASRRAWGEGGGGRARVPPPSAIAHQLIAAWHAGTLRPRDVPTARL